MTILFCSVGRRATLLKNFKKSLSSNVRIIAADCSKTAPALYLADAHYIVPRIDDPTYIDTVLDICKKEKVDAITTLIDPEIALLARHRNRFEEYGIEVLAPFEETAQLCFDKYKMYCYLTEKGIATVDTWGTLESAKSAIADGTLSFPVFVKPRTGSGSVGAQKVDDLETLTQLCKNDDTLIIQRLMRGVDMDADVYIDTVSHLAVSAFSKRKLETKIGGASKTVSFKDNRLFEFIQQIVSVFQFNGPVDMDFFYVEGEYYLSEINPRFGGAYLHAYGAGVDFIELIMNNVNGKANEPCFGDYEDDIVMMMYDDVVIEKIPGICES